MAGSVIEAWSHDNGKGGRSGTALHGVVMGEGTKVYGHGKVIKY